MRMRKWKANRPPTLLEIHQHHYRNFGVFLALHEETDPDDYDRVSSWWATL